MKPKRARAKANTRASAQASASIAVSVGVLACTATPAPHDDSAGAGSSGASAKATSQTSGHREDGAASSAPESQFVTEAARQIASRIESEVVSDKELARRVLYTWTVPDQAQEIVAKKPFLSRSVSSQYGPSAFDWALLDLANGGDELATTLRSEGFAKKRFAWPNAYGALARGYNYGNVLVRVELAVDAIILDLSNRRAVTTLGEPVPLEALTKDGSAGTPSRLSDLAAVFWSNDEFREYVLVNESKIETISFGSEDTINAQKNAIDLHESFIAALKLMNEKEANQLFAQYERSLVFREGIDSARLDAILFVLRSTVLDKTTHSGAPQVRRFSLGAIRPALQPDCKAEVNNDFSYRFVTCSPTDRCIPSDMTCVAIKRAGMTFSLDRP